MTAAELIQYLNSDSIEVTEKGLLIVAYVQSIHMNPEEKERKVNQILPIVLQYDEPEYLWSLHVCYNAILHEYGRNLDASHHAYEMLKVAEKHKKSSWKSDAYVGLYKIHIELRLHDQAEEFLKKATKAAYESGDPERISVNAYLMGYTYYTAFQNDSAIYYLKQADHYNRKRKENTRTPEYTYLLARTLIRANELDLAIAMLDSIVHEREQSISDYYGDYYYAGSLMYMSQAYAKKGMIDSSDYLFEKCLDSYITFDSSLYNYAHVYNGMTYAALGYHDRALRSFNYLADSTDFTIPKEYIANVHVNLGNYKQATQYYQEAIIEKDSTQKAAMNEMSTLLEESSKSELEIQKQIDREKQEAAEQQAAYQKQQKNLVLLGVMIIGILIVLFGRVLYRRYQIIKAQKEEINAQKLQVEEKNEEILDSIFYAKRIQEAILPPDKIFKQFLPDSFILYKPKDVVAGDFYWMEHKADLVIFAAADCTGHGVPGAMVSVVCNNALNRSVREFGLTDPAAILDKTRDLVIETFVNSENEVKDGMDIALCTLNLKTNELRFAGANNPLYLISNGEAREFKGDKQPIGTYADQKPFTSHLIQLQKDDQFYIFTDGFSDQFGGEKGKKFKPKKFRDLLVRYQRERTEKVKILLDTAFEKWRGDIEQVDDVCVIGVRI